MNTYSINYLNLLRTVIIGGLLFLSVNFPSPANAAQGCGFGYHLSIYGGCILNHPGRFATPAPRHPGCWRNRWGQLRCYR